MLLILIGFNNPVIANKINIEYKKEKYIKNKEQYLNTKNEMVTEIVLDKDEWIVNLLCNNNAKNNH